MKKFWIWSSVILGVFVVLITLSFTLFTLKSVNMTFHNSTTLFSTGDKQQEIIEDADFKYNASILFMDKHTCIAKLEKDFPYLKVINIETIFPNSYTIHCKEREPVFALEFSTGYYVLDKDLKVLSVESGEFVSEQTNYIKLSTLTPQTTSYVAGEFINIPEINVLKNISPAFELTNRDIIMQMALIKDITVTTTPNIEEPTDTTNYSLIMHDFNNLEIIIDSAKTHLAEKLNYFFAVQSQFVGKQSDFYCLVYENNNTIKAQAVKLS